MNNTTDLLTTSILREAVHLLEQSCIKIRHCLNQLDDQQAWFRTHPSANSIGNLILHIAGNLNQWVTSGVGQKPDHRDREAEFAADQSLSQTELLKRMEQAVTQATAAIQSCDAAILLSSFEIQGFQVNGHEAISHTTTHFVGHTHQIIFITRMILGDRYQFQWSPDADRNQVPI